MFSEHSNIGGKADVLGAFQETEFNIRSRSQLALCVKIN